MYNIYFLSFIYLLFIQLFFKINEFLKTYTGNLVLNNDDPNVARLGKANPENKNIYYFSVERYAYATDNEKEAGEGKFCPFCKTRLEYEYYQYSHIGKFKCPNCGYGNNPIYKQVIPIDQILCYKQFLLLHIYTK